MISLISWLQFNNKVGLYYIFVRRKNKWQIVDTMFIPIKFLIDVILKPNVSSLTYIDLMFILPPRKKIHLFCLHVIIRFFFLFDTHTHKVILSGVSKQTRISARISLRAIGITFLSNKNQSYTQSKTQHIFDQEQAACVCEY